MPKKMMNMKRLLLLFILLLTAGVTWAQGIRIVFKDAAGLEPVSVAFTDHPRITHSADGKTMTLTTDLSATNYSTADVLRVEHVDEVISGPLPIFLAGIDLNTADPSELPAGVSFDPETLTLTLDNAKVLATDDGDAPEEAWYGLYTRAQLNLVIKGECSIGAQLEDAPAIFIVEPGSVTITGAKSTLPTTFSTEVAMEDGEYLAPGAILSGGQIKVKGPGLTANFSGLMGIYGDEGSAFEIDGANVSIWASGGNPAFICPGFTLKNARFEDAADYYDADDAMVYHTTGDDYDYSTSFHIVPYVKGDLNGDGYVTIGDGVLLIHRLNDKGAPYAPEYDVNDDTSVDKTDLDVLLDKVLEQ